MKRNVMPSLATADVVGSGYDSPLFNATKSCKAAPDKGPCHGNFQSYYYYNSSSMSCEFLQNYRGCLSNQNNFLDERECLQRCRTEAVCRLPMVAQACTVQPPIWAFDSTVGLCVPYKQGFCQGNGNKFYSKAECAEYCEVMNDEYCKAEPDTGPCRGSFPRYYYNSSSMSCELFSYGGCAGNQNNFLHERECLQKCRTEAMCRLPMVAQACTVQPPIWAFDSTVGLCVPHKQGFCQGNANKFYSKAECDEYCGVMNDEGQLLKAN